LTYVAPGKVSDMIRSMLVYYQQSYDKVLPIWSFQGSETWTMIGYHAVSVISDAYLKGIRDYDTELAFKAMLDTANSPLYDAIPEYKKFGYVPMDKLGESVSITLEYAYDHFAIAQMAKAMGKTKVANTFYERAQSYRNVCNPKVKFMRGKDSKGRWNPDFDAEEAALMGPFTEGNSFQYTFYVPHDVPGLIDLIGGDSAFEQRLDLLFNKTLSHDKFNNAATKASELDLSNEGCPVFCRGQHPSLDQWLSINYIAGQSNSWEGASETLEQAAAFFALFQLAFSLDQDKAGQLWHNSTKGCLRNKLTS
jgi:predicted alpha-1,2-mannosidase